MKSIAGAVAAGLVFAACSSSGSSPTVGGIVCADLPLRQEAIAQRDAEIDRTIAGAEIESPQLAASIDLWSLHGPVQNRETWILRRLPDAGSDDLRQTIESLPIDWETESLVLVSPFAVQGSMRFAIRGSTFEIHVARAFPCFATEPEQNVGGMAGMPSNWLAFRIPKSVSDVRIKEHAAPFRLPSHEPEGRCTIATTNRSSRHWHAVSQEVAGYRMWSERWRDDCSGTGTTCSEVYVSDSSDGTHWTSSHPGEELRAEFDPRGSSPLDWFRAPGIMREDGGGYLMLYFFLSELHASRSEDGIVWEEGAKVLGPLQSPSGRYLSVETLGAFRNDEGYWVWIEASEWDGDRVPRIYLVRSEDGRTWTQVGDGPVLREGPPGSFDELGVGSPRVYREDGKFVMVYTGQYGGGEPWGLLLPALAMAESGDGVHWTKRDRPLLVPDPVFERLGSPSVVRFGNRLLVWYSKLDGTILQADCGW